MSAEGPDGNQNTFIDTFPVCHDYFPCARPIGAGKIVITYPSRSIASVDLYIAQERGFFRQEGLLADVVQGLGNIGVTALLSGDAHAINNVGTLIRAMERSDLPAKVVSQSLKKSFVWGGLI